MHWRDIFSKVIWKTVKKYAVAKDQCCFVVRATYFCFRSELSVSASFPGYCRNIAEYHTMWEAGTNR